MWQGGDRGEQNMIFFFVWQVFDLVLVFTFVIFSPPIVSTYVVAFLERGSS